MTRAYWVYSSAQLRRMYIDLGLANRRIENLMRVWHSQEVLASVNYKGAPPERWALIRFDSKGPGNKRTCSILKVLHGKQEVIGALPYNKALKWCAEYLIQESE